MRLSFIIPAFNSSATIARTLDSIYCAGLNESDFEIIIIDDCSTDNTIEIVQHYSSFKDNLVMLRQQQNHRQGAARNRGIIAANGEYIFFVDSDDTVEPGLSKALDFAEKSKVDVLFCDIFWMYSYEHIETRSIINLTNESIMSGRVFAEKYYDTTLNTCPVSYLWRKEYLMENRHFFIEDRRMEDYDFIEKNIYFANKIGYCASIIYRVRTFENPMSTTHCISYETQADWIHSAFRRLIFCETIEHASPSYAGKIRQQCRIIVNGHLNMQSHLQFSYNELRLMYERIGHTVLSSLLKVEKWPLSITLALRFPLLTSICYSICKRVLYSKSRCIIKSL